VLLVRATSIPKHEIFPIFTLLFGFLLRAPSAGTRARKENEAAKKNCFRRGGAGEKKSIRNETAEKEWHERLDNTFSGSESRFVLLAQWRVGGRQESSLLIRSIDKRIPPKGQRHPKDKKKKVQRLRQRTRRQTNGNLRRRISTLIIHPTNSKSFLSRWLSCFASSFKN
jgi:hypothetical protein